MKDSWLNPKGEIIKVEDFRHNEYAHELLEKEMGFQALVSFRREHNKSDTEILHDRGWVRVKINTAYLPRIQLLGNCIDLTKPRKNTMDPAMNSKQLRVAKQLCEEHNTTLHVAVNDKRFW